MKYNIIYNRVQMVEKLVQAKMPKIIGKKKDDISEKDEFSLPQIVSRFPDGRNFSISYRQ